MAKSPVVLSIMVTVLFCLAAFSEGNFSAGRDITGSLRSGGLERRYFVHLPPQYDGRRALPVVLALHGGGGRGDRMDSQTGLTSLADRQGFIVVYPNGTGRFGDRLLTWNSWNCCGFAHVQNIDDVSFFRALISRLKVDYRVDSRRIFATGMSNGGMMTYRLGCELSDQIAAIAPVAGALNGPCAPSSPVSVIIFHGIEDQHVPFAGGSPRKKVDPHERIDNSVATAVSFWVGRDKCNRSPSSESRADAKITRYRSCNAGTEVVLYAIQDQGHAWPGGNRGTLLADIPSTMTSASELIWDFFKSHPKP
ncbi:MAG: PHB depolymerase family esterase [Acidobacteriota bacterium]